MISLDIMVSVKDRSEAVPVDTFGEHVQRMHADRDKWFEQEYNVREIYVEITHFTLCNSYHPCHG